MKLKPCPFCGCEPRIILTMINEESDIGIQYSVWCENCDDNEGERTVKTHKWLHKEQAIKSWNVRPEDIISTEE